MSSLLEILPPDRRDAANAALTQAFSRARPTLVQPIAGGVSALTYRVEVGSRAYALRLEGRRGGMSDPARGYACLAMAAEAGIAPALRHADAATGVAILDYIAPVPLETYPGGPEARAADIGQLLQRLQGIADFPIVADYPALLERMLHFVMGSALFAPGLLEPHAEAFARLRAAYPWGEEAPCASHNDPNARNLIFDGQRLWLIDWETAFRNDPLVDLAIVANEQADTPALEAALLSGWRPGPKPAGLGARLMLMRQFVRLYYAMLLFSGFAMTAPSTPVSDLAAPTVAEFVAMVSDGRLRVGTPEVAFTLGKMNLAAFLAYARGPLVAAALAELGG